jgi:nitrogen fixation-related uncharacterized protein
MDRHAVETGDVHPMTALLALALTLAAVAVAAFIHAVRSADDGTGDGL